MQVQNLNPLFYVMTLVAKPAETQGVQRNSLLRSYLWIQFKNLYESYVHGRYLVASDKELRGLIQSIIGDLSQAQIMFFLTDLFKLNLKFIEFEPFATHYLLLIAQLRLSRYSQYHQLNNKTLSKDEFGVLFKNIYTLLSIEKMKVPYLQKIYLSVDLNKDGVVSYDEYLDCIRRFIAVFKYYQNQYYFSQDDLDLNDPNNLFQPYRQPIQIKKDQSKIVLTFKDCALACQVRQRIYSLLIQFDVRKDHLF